jgi:hypothetical protein
LLGLALPDALRSKVRARGVETKAKGNGFGKANSILLLYLQGSPSHIDTWDPKPDAPDGIRGEFKTIATRVPGIRLTEVLPQLARQSHRFSLIRSLGVKPQGLANHGASIYMLMTGAGPLNFSATGLSVPPSRQDLPSVGAISARYRPAEPGRFGFVSVCAPIQEGAVSGAGLHDRHGEVGVVVSRALSQINQVELLAADGIGSGEDEGVRERRAARRIREDERAGGSFHRHQVAVDVGVGEPGWIHQRGRGEAGFEWFDVHGIADCGFWVGFTVLAASRPRRFPRRR